MRVVLRDDVAGVGNKGDVVDVAAGYGRNFLLPRGLALLSSKGAEAQARAAKARAEKETAKARKRASKQVDEAQAAVEAAEERVEALID